MTFDIPGSGIRLATYSDCPHCGRPLLGLASDRCGYCGLPLGTFQELPDVAARLEVLARGWTPGALAEWARPRPGQLLWAQGTGHWKLLGHWAAEDLWRTWARLFANLKGRWQARAVEDLVLGSVRICGIGEFEPWVKLRIAGSRSDYRWDPATGQALQGRPEPAPFQEVWTFQPTGQPLEKTGHACRICGGGLDFEDAACPYCGCPVDPVPGPWRLVSVRAEPGFRSPFEATALGPE